MKALTRQQVREFDRRAVDDFGLPSLVLMENAGRGAAEVLRSLGVDGRVVVCCGKGNNGGDGFVIARHLANHGVAVKLLLARPGELSADAAVQWRVVERMRLPAEVLPDEARLREELADAAWVVDALFGTGLHKPLGPPFDAAVNLINASAARVLAVDVPSGLDADTGRPMGACVRAHHTVTFVAPKVGFAQPGADAWLGRVHVVDIGITPAHVKV